MIEGQYYDIFAVYTRDPFKGLLESVKLDQSVGGNKEHLLRYLGHLPPKEARPEFHMCFFEKIFKRICITYLVTLSFPHQ